MSPIHAGHEFFSGPASIKRASVGRVTPHCAYRRGETRFRRDTRRIGAYRCAAPNGAMCCAQLDALQVEKHTGADASGERNRSRAPRATFRSNVFFLSTALHGNRRDPALNNALRRRAGCTYARPFSHPMSRSPVTSPPARNEACHAFFSPGTRN